MPHTNESRESNDNKHSKLELMIEEMFQNESDRINDEEEIETSYSKVIISIVAILMSAVILISFIYRFL